MMKKYLLALAVVIISGISTAALATPSSVINDSACKTAIQQKQSLAGCTDANGNPIDANAPGLGQQGGYLTELLDVFIFAAGFLAFVFLLVGAFRYITSTGDAKRIQAAKDTVMYSLIGLIVVILARLVVGFIIESAS